MIFSRQLRELTMESKYSLLNIATLTVYKNNNYLSTHKGVKPQTSHVTLNLQPHKRVVLVGRLSAASTRKAHFLRIDGVSDTFC